MDQLPDGSSFTTASYPLPQDHWLYVSGIDTPPMPFRVGTDCEYRKGLANKIREAGKYAIRASTMNGKMMDFDPDAMLQNLIIGMIGYYTPDGQSDL